MGLNLRCRGPSGQVTLAGASLVNFDVEYSQMSCKAPSYAGLSPSLPVKEFLDLLHEKTGVPPASQELLLGFPPKPRALPSDLSAQSLSDLGLVSGDTFTLRAATAAADAVMMTQTEAPKDASSAPATLAAAPLNHISGSSAVAPRSTIHDLVREAMRGGAIRAQLGDALISLADETRPLDRMRMLSWLGPLKLP